MSSSKYKVAPAERPQFLFPMWVVPIRAMLELAKSCSESGSTLPMHEELQRTNRLVAWEPGMKTIFLSHTAPRPGAQQRGRTEFLDTAQLYDSLSPQLRALADRITVTRHGNPAASFDTARAGSA